MINTEEDLLNSYTEERCCEYRGEVYSVRDNGSIMRHPREGKKVRPLDNKWTFGNPNTYGYCCINGVLVHQIVCTAFHGVIPASDYVVDHYDTNRQNNRPENLRWVTKLENALNNPYTRSKIERICGSVESFLANPSMLKEAELEPEFDWMRAVTKEEGANTLANWEIWMAKPYKEKKQNQSIGKEWMFAPPTKQPIQKKEQLPEYIESLSPNALQESMNWKTPTEFPLCPTTGCTLLEYLNNLNKGAIFTRNKYSNYSTIYDFALAKDKEHEFILVINKFPEGNVKEWGLCEIFTHDGKFAHKSHGTYFKEDGAVKYFTIKQGKEWTGGDVLDDFC